jgi:hypothetical protein
MQRKIFPIAAAVVLGLAATGGSPCAWRGWSWRRLRRWSYRRLRRRPWRHVGGIGGAHIGGGAARMSAALDALILAVSASVSA